MAQPAYKVVPLLHSKWSTLLSQWTRVAILIIFYAAFDAIDYANLLWLCHSCKPHEYVSWYQGAAHFKSYQLNRTRIFMIQNSESCTVALEYGVLQWLVLEPVIFIYFLLPNHLIKSHVVGRHNLWITAFTCHFNLAVLHEECKDFQNSYLADCIQTHKKFNSDKTKILLPGSRRLNFLSFSVAWTDIQISEGL